MNNNHINQDLFTNMLNYSIILRIWAPCSDKKSNGCEYQLIVPLVQSVKMMPIVELMLHIAIIEHFITKFSHYLILFLSQ